MSSIHSRDRFLVTKQNALRSPLSRAAPANVRARPRQTHCDVITSHALQESVPAQQLDIHSASRPRVVDSKTRPDLNTQDQSTPIRPKQHENEASLPESPLSHSDNLSFAEACHECGWSGRKTYVVKRTLS